MNIFQMPMNNDVQFNNQKKMNNPMLMNNMINMPMNNMLNMPINNMMNMPMNNMLNMPINNMMNMPINNMMNMPINNMMNKPMNNMMNMPINNMMNMQMNNNLMNNPMLVNNMMNNPMQMNNIINNPMSNNKMMNNPINDNFMAMQMMMNLQMLNNFSLNNQNNHIGNQGQNISVNNQNNNNNNGSQGKNNQNKMIFPRKNHILKKREIPPILQKNANKKIETITFQVEKGLKPTNEFFQTHKVNEILGIFFRKKAINEKGQEIYLYGNEPLEILHYKFDTDKTEIFNFGKKSLIQGLILAYKNHFPINVSPDMIWLLILQGYSKFMYKYSELVRGKYVNFEGQKILHINRYGIPLNKATEEDWNGIIDECIEQIGDNIGEEIISNLQSDFSTTNAATLLASKASIMSAMKDYFNYEVSMGGCGISYIILEGSLEDWQKIKSKLEYLSNFGLKWWTNHLIPIIDNIIKTKKYYDKNKKINSEMVDFWKKMIRLKGAGNFYDPHVINGWIIKFIPDLSGEQPKLFDEINERFVPDQIFSCPLKIIEDTSNGFKVEYNCDIASGFFGMIQDKKSLSVKPVIGYAFVVEEKKTSPMTREDKEEIIKNYFN